LIAIVIVVVLLVGVVLAIVMAVRRSAALRAAHDARLKTMASAYLAAAKKKQIAEAAKAAKAAEPAAMPSAVPVREERDCPFCAEPILKKARVCKHCGRDVEPLA
jgi:hypothetical protein